VNEHSISVDTCIRKPTLKLQLSAAKSRHATSCSLFYTWLCKWQWRFKILHRVRKCQQFYFCVGIAGGCSLSCTNGKNPS